MNKAELSAQYKSYRAAVAKAIHKEAAHDYVTATTHAVVALAYLDGALQHLSKYEDFFTGRHAVDVVLDLAPLHFNANAIDTLSKLRESSRRVSSSFPDLKARIAAARELLATARSLWDGIERGIAIEVHTWAGNNPPLRDLKRLLAAWEESDVIRRRDNPDAAPRFVTRMDDAVLGKCPQCGAVVRAPKAKLLNDATCPKCGKSSLFVILAREPKGP